MQNGFAALFEPQNKSLTAEYQALMERQQQIKLAPQLPEALLTSSFQQFKAKGNTKKQAMTGVEIVEAKARKKAATLWSPS